MRLLSATPIVAACACAVLAAAGPVAADEPPAACVSGSSVETSDGIALRFESSCTTSVRCQVDWMLTCTGGKATRRYPGRAGFALAAGAYHAESASKSACGPDDWNVDDVRWRCDPP